MMTREDTPYLPALRLNPSADDEDLSVLWKKWKSPAGIWSLCSSISLEGLDARSNRRNRRRDHAG